MKFRPQLKLVAWGVSLALIASAPAAYAGGWGAPTEGDTGQGVDTVIGNGLNPRGLDTTVQPDDNGLGPFRAPVAHTPTGAQYSVPWTEPADPSFYGDIEFGYIGAFGDASANKFDEYRDFSSFTGGNNGLTINNFNFGAEKNGHYFRFAGGGVSNTDQYYTGAIGSYNDWRLRFFYNETPHVFQNDAKLIWSGAGTNTLTLLPQFQQNLINAGGRNSTLQAPTATQNPNAAFLNSALRTTIAQVGDSTLALYRKKGGLRWDQPLNDKWSFYASYNVERRTGDRDFGQTGGGFPGAALPNANATNGQPIEVVEPINYTTHEVALGTGYVDDKNALNISLTSSIFQDAIKDVYWEDPDVSPFQVAAAPAGVIQNRTWQSFTTPPSNQAYNLNVDYNRMLGVWNGSLALNGSIGRQNQNDAVQPYTDATGASGAGPQNNFALWNASYGPNGLPTTTRLNSGLHNNVSLLNLGLNLQPTDALSVAGKLRYYGVKNTNDYLSCNPSLAAYYQTTCANGITSLANGATVSIGGVNYTTAGIATVNGVNYAPIYGYMGEDGNNLDTATLNATNNRTGAFDTSFHQFNGGLSADYQLASKTSINLSYERENVYRAERERAWTFEDKIKLGLVDRGLGAGTLRVSYEYDNRKGTDTRFQPYLESLCAGEHLGNSLVCNTIAVNGNPAETANPLLGTKYDLSDRKQNIFIVRYNYMFTETLDAMLTGKLNIQKYPDPLGRDTRSEHNLSAELNWTPDTLTNVYGALTYEGANQSQTSVPNYYSNCNVSLGPCTYDLGGSNSFFGNIYNQPANAVTAFRYTTDDKNWFFNLGANHKFAAVRIDANYTFTKTTSPIDFTGFNLVSGNVGGTLAAPNQFEFPDMSWKRHQLNVNVTYPISEKLALHGLYMFDKADSADWHYDGLSALADVTGAGRYYLNGGGNTESYKAHVLAIFAQYKM